ncbi:hypothetical protein COF09_11165 [Bacillus toyonensis]|uniref:hypothetical protein n=1 Tax=Bacillus toyonensis TaxID=155322 RepID=UPI000BFCCEE8|nr:hypothetical protein [Bacillus toyonensis]PHC43815.1 hypothetical protein COF09_11165 [Bacillus toyonensis]
MIAQLYLHRNLREKYIKPFNLYKKIYNDKILNLFSNIEDEAKEIANNYYYELGKNFNPNYSDPSDYAEQAQEIGLEYYEDMALMEYTTKLALISNLYQFWEQQVRHFLYDEIKKSQHIPVNRGKEIPYQNFGTSIVPIKNFFMIFGQNIEQLSSWETIDELRVLSNVIKHGDGNSAVDLARKNPNFLKSEYSDINLLELYGTTLNERVLNFKEISFDRYADALIEFWNELPERMFAN